MIASRSLSTWLLGLAALSTGCAASRPELSPGLAGLEVKVVAEPKRADLTAFDSSTDPYALPGERNDIYERLDYDRLPGIVVWVEPAAARSDLPAPQPTAIALSVSESRGGSPLPQGASVAGVVVFTNDSSRPLSVYSVSTGNEFDLGTVAAGKSVRWTLRSEGLIEVLTDSSPEPIALIYVVRSPWVRTARSRDTLHFANLPPGTYRAACWHLRLPGSSKQVALMPDRYTSTTLVTSVKLLGPRSEKSR